VVIGAVLSKYTRVMRDIDIREALRAEIDRRHHGESNTLVVEELGLCQGIARIDLAVVNGSVNGYEIKSAHDTLARLPAQSDVYSKALDFVTIVTASDHAERIRRLVPSWWGIWVAVQGRDGRVRLESVREPCRNHTIDAFAVAQLLWRSEALDALESHGLATGIRSKPRQELWRRLASDLTLEELGKVVRESLKKRGPGWRVAVSQGSGDGLFQPFAT
jgi:hypothetical protein